MQDNFRILGAIVYIRLETDPNRVEWASISTLKYQPLLRYRFL